MAGGKGAGIPPQNDSSLAGRANLDPKAIPWPALRKLLEEVFYGGRVDNLFDQRALSSFLAQLARPSLIPSLCTHFTRAGIEWRRCHHAVCMTRPYKEPHHSGQAEP